MPLVEGYHPAVTELQQAWALLPPPGRVSRGVSGTVQSGPVPGAPVWKAPGLAPARNTTAVSVRHVPVPALGTSREVARSLPRDLRRGLGCDWQECSAVRGQRLQLVHLCSLSKIACSEKLL